jgi:two-component system sensor histidine kinase KdpD
MLNTYVKLFVKIISERFLRNLMIKVKKIIKKILPTLIHIIVTLFFLFLATAIGLLFKHVGFSETNIVIIYILAILIIACLSKGYVYGITSAIAATFSFNFFFTEPVYTFNVNDAGYIVTFAVMAITAIITSTLTSKIKQNVEKAKAKEIEANALYKLTSNIVDAKDIVDIISTGIRVVSETFKCNAACVYFAKTPVYIKQKGTEQFFSKIDNVDILKKKAEFSRNGEEKGNEYWDYIIYEREEILGFLRLPKETAETLNDFQKKLLHSMIESLGLAMDSYISKEAKIILREETAKERYRSNLLRAISHDIRTPLSGIIGTSEMLMNITKNDMLSYEYAKEINSDAIWLHSLVENILSLTRLRDGNIALKKQSEAIEEIIGTAIARLKKQYPECNITVTVPNDLLFVPMDAKLIEQVFINLMDNAVKYNGSNVKIEIEVYEEDKNAVVKVSDNGKGIKSQDLAHLFETFYKSDNKSEIGKKGVGLGLSICETIIKAHSGTISAKNRENKKGAEFCFKLPLKDMQ